MAVPQLAVDGALDPPVRRWRGRQLVGAAAFVAAAFLALSLGAAGGEAAAVEALLNARGWSGVSAQGPVFVVWSGQGPPSTLKITWSCSALVQVAAVGGALLAFGTARGRARLAGVAVGAAIVVVGNLVRLAATVWLAANGGDGAALVFHDWGGTAITLVMGAVGIALGALVAHRLAERHGHVPVAAGHEPGGV